MKHLKAFNENSQHINDILNIARDEGLNVTEQDQAARHGWTSRWFESWGIFIDRYPVNANGIQIQGTNPIVSNPEFIRIVKDIFNRLGNEVEIGRNKLVDVDEDTLCGIEEILDDHIKYQISYAFIELI